MHSAYGSCSSFVAPVSWRHIMLPPFDEHKNDNLHKKTFSLVYRPDLVPGQALVAHTVQFLCLRAHAKQQHSAPCMASTT